MKRWKGGKSRPFQVLIAVMSFVYGCSGGSGGAENSADTLNDSEQRSIASDGLQANDALFFVADTLFAELGVLLDDEPDEACANSGSVQINRSADAATFQFTDCALSVQSEVIAEGVIILGSTQAQASTAPIAMEFTGVELSNGPARVRIDGDLIRRDSEGSIFLAGDADLTLFSAGIADQTISVQALTLLLDRSRVYALREVGYQAMLAFDGEQREFDASGSVQGGSAGCPLSGRWSFTVNEAGSVGVNGAEGGNLLLDGGTTSSTLACSELRLLDVSSRIGPPPPPGS